MELYNGNIRVRDLMKNPGAQQILRREFPGVIGSPMFRMAQNMSLNQVMSKVSGRMPQHKINQVLQQLKDL